MPPEQARGLVAGVGQRSDVFGLGAVLCKILTGQPPCIGPDAGSVRLQAIEACPDGACARLEACGADAELIRLAKRCLAPSKADRPAEGGEVATPESNARVRITLGKIYFMARAWPRITRFAGGSSCSSGGVSPRRGGIRRPSGRWRRRGRSSS